MHIPPHPCGRFKSLSPPNRSCTSCGTFDPPVSRISREFLYTQGRTLRRRLEALRTFIKLTQDPGSIISNALLASANPTIVDGAVLTGWSLNSGLLAGAPGIFAATQLKIANTVNPSRWGAYDNGWVTVIDIYSCIQLYVHNKTCKMGSVRMILVLIATLQVLQDRLFRFCNCPTGIGLKLADLDHGVLHPLRHELRLAIYHPSPVLHVSFSHTANIKELIVP
jgi:hypothetical protein